MTLRREKSLRRCAQDDRGKLCGLIDAGYQGRRPLKLAPVFLYPHTSLPAHGLSIFSQVVPWYNPIYLIRATSAEIRGMVFFTLKLALIKTLTTELITIGILHRPPLKLHPRLSGILLWLR